MNILYEQAKTLIDPDLPFISNLSNLLSLCFYESDQINWIGFYLCDHDHSICTLGPFQGKVACTTIPFGSGVVGSCAQSQQMIAVDDVHQFPGHIACDSSSASELVIPFLDDRGIYAILDIDALVPGYFDQEKILLYQEIASLFQSFFFRDSLSTHKPN